MNPTTTTTDSAFAGQGKKQNQMKALKRKLKPVMEAEDKKEAPMSPQAFKKEEKSEKS